MSKSNPLSYLPSRDTAMRWLLYLVLLLVKFGVMLYENELPGRQSDAEAEGAQDVPFSSTTGVAAPEVAAAAAERRLSTHKAAACETVRGEMAYGHHLLFGRAVACSRMQADVEKKAMVDASTQTDPESTAPSNSSDPLAGEEAERKAMVDALTQTSEDDGRLSRSSGGPLSPTSLVNTPTDHSSEVDADASEQHDAAQCDGMVHEAQGEEEQVQESNAADEEIPTAIQDLREEVAQLRAQIARRDGRLERYRRLLDENDESHEQLEEENTDLRSRLDQANLRVSELEFFNETLWARVEDLSSEVVWMLELFVWGRGELSFFVQLGARLYARIVKVEKDMVIRRSDSLVNLAGRRLSEYVTVERYIRDLVTEHRVGLKIEGPPAHRFAIHGAEVDFACERTPDDDALEQLVDEVYGATRGEAVNNGNVAGIILGDHAVTPDHALANDSNAPNAKESAQDSKVGANTPLFGAHTNSIPILDDTTTSGRFDFASPTGFDFGASTPFKAGATPSTTRAKDFRVASHDESEAGPSEKMKNSPTIEVTAGYDSSPSSSDNEEEEVHKRKKTAPLFEAAAGINLSPPGSGTKEKAAEKTKTASIFDAAATVSLFPLPSDNKAPSGKSFEQNAKGSSENTKLPSMGCFNFTETATKAEEETRPLFAAETSTQFSFLPSGFVPTFGGFNHDLAGPSNASLDLKLVDVDVKEEQKQGSTKESATPPLFTAEAFAKFDSPASSGAKAELFPFNFGTTDAREVKADSFSNVFNFGSVAGKHEQEDDGTSCAATFWSSSPPTAPSASARSEGSPLSGDLPQLSSPSTANTNAGSAFSWNFSGSSSLSSDVSKDTSFGKCSGQGVLPGDTNPASSPIVGSLPASSPPSTKPSTGFAPLISDVAKAPSSSKGPIFSIDAFRQFNASKADVQRPSVMSSETTHDTLALQAPTLANPAENEDGSLVRRPSSTREGLAGSPREIVEYCPDLAGNYDELYEIEDGYVPPAKRPTTVERVQKEPESAMETADVLSKNGFDPAALGRIVDSASPAARGNLLGGKLVMRLIWQSGTPISGVKTNGARRAVWQGRGRTAAEISAGWDVECRERTKQQIATVPWRESEWPAALPPLHSRELEWVAGLPELVTPPITAATAHQGAEATDEEIVRLMGAMEALHIGPSEPGAIVRNFKAEVHVLSGDWVERRNMTRPTMHQQADDKEEMMELDEEPRSREGEPEAVGERPQDLEQSDMEIEDEMVSEELPRAPTGDAQEAMVICEQEANAESEVAMPREAMVICTQEANAEPEVAMPNEPQVTVSPTGSDDLVRPQMPPQTEVQENSTVTSHAQTPKTHEQMVPQLQTTATSPSHPPQTPQQPTTQDNTTATPSSTQPPLSTPRDKKGGLCIWSLRKK